jgi:hypothetical protein
MQRVWPDGADAAHRSPPEQPVVEKVVLEAHAISNSLQPVLEFQAGTLWFRGFEHDPPDAVLAVCSSADCEPPEHVACVQAPTETVVHSFWELHMLLVYVSTIGAEQPAPLTEPQPAHEQVAGEKTGSLKPLTACVA